MCANTPNAGGESRLPAKSAKSKLTAADADAAAVAANAKEAHSTFQQRADFQSECTISTMTMTTTINNRLQAGWYKKKVEE